MESGLFNLCLTLGYAASSWNCSTQDECRKCRCLCVCVCVCACFTWATLCSDNGFSSACKENWHYCVYQEGKKSSKIYDKDTRLFMLLAALTSSNQIRIWLALQHMTVKPNHFRNGPLPIPYTRTLRIKTKWGYKLDKGRVGSSERWIKASRSPNDGSCSTCCGPYAANHTEPYGASALGFCLGSKACGSFRGTSAGAPGFKRPFLNKTEETDRSFSPI